MKLFYIFFLIFLIPKAFAYPNFIGHNYTSCLNCHYNPFGGGPLTDYGRAVSATAISSRALYPDKVSEERLAYLSGFLFQKPKQNFLRTQINYRGFQLVRNPGSKDSETKQWINMQADARLILKFGENDKFVSVFNYGYSPQPMNRGREKYDEWRTREHYIGYRFSPKVGVYAGLMDKVYGLRVIEHIAYSRVTPQVTQNDQVHGAFLHYLGEKWESGLHGFVGNLIQDEDLRMKGFSATTERTVFDLHRLGVSFLNSKNEYLELVSYSTHARLNLKDGSAVLAEVGQTTRKTENQTDDRTSRFGLIQTYLRPYRGLYFLTNVEYQANDIKEKPYSVRWGPGVQYFPLQRLELRFDIYNSRNFSPTSSTKDSWMYLLQTHIWL